MIQNRLVKIIIPLYTTEINKYEKASLAQTHNMLSRYPITIVKPASLNIDHLLKEFPNFETENFDDSFFIGVSSYNRLMMSSEFYTRFIDYKYILICQLDAYIFKDELEDWCSRDYDYIGAPWLVRPIYNFPLFRLISWIRDSYCRVSHHPNPRLLEFKAGNGGLSLRKVSKHLKATDLLTETIKEYLSHKKNHLFNEDVFFSVEVNKHGLNFLYPNYQEALKFSFDKYPKLCFQKNNQQLPFGCHSWHKRKMKQFWLPIIMEQRNVSTK